jgi:hypothetical protein
MDRALMRRGRWVQGVSGLTLAASSLLLFFSANEWPPTVDRAFHGAIGEAMARETLSLVKPGAGVVVVVRDTEEFRHPESEAQVRGFEKVLKAGGSTVVSVQSLQVDPLRPLEVPSGDFYELLRKVPPGTAIVSFMGPPKLTEEQRGRLGEIRPKVIAFCPGAIPRTTDLRGMFESGLLHSAVVERDGAVGGKRSDFASLYRVVRGAEAGTLPQVSGEGGMP